MLNEKIRGRDAIWMLLDALPDDGTCRWRCRSKESLLESLVAFIGNKKTEEFIESFCLNHKINVPELHDKQAV